MELKKITMNLNVKTVINKKNVMKKILLAFLLLSGCAVMGPADYSHLPKNDCVLECKIDFRACRDQLKINEETCKKELRACSQNCELNSPRPY